MTEMPKVEKNMSWKILDKGRLAQLRWIREQLLQIEVNYHLKVNLVLKKELIEQLDQELEGGK